MAKKGRPTKKSFPTKKVDKVSEHVLIPPVESIDTDNISVVGRALVVRGNFNQGDSRFSDESRGNQCTAIACAAVCYDFYSSV